MTREQQRAREAGRQDARNGSHENAPRWPNGAEGHADYWLGRQDVEFAGTELSDLPSQE